MKVELKQLQAKLGTTFVYITHDQSEALVMSDQVAVMNGGRFEQVGTPQALYYDPQTTFVAGFVGNSNRWTGRVTDRDATRLHVRTDGGLTLTGRALADMSVGDAADIFVRPEAIALSRPPDPSAQADNVIAGTVQNLLFDGGNSMAMVHNAETGQTVTVALPQTGEFADLAPGEPVGLSWEAAQAPCFAAAP